MSPLNALIFGLGLFFLGLRLVSENLSALAGGSLRDGIARTTRRPLLRVVLGLSSGALMQSATAVTFICVSMVAAGLLTTSAAAVVIVWCNVGLTVLAFVATLDIHPAVAFVVGGSGIVMGVVRIRSWQTVAGVLLGMGLILLGLQQMGEGAAPLKEAAWFKSGMDIAVTSPALAFLAGTLAAAILQSNTGATMMIIALSGAGAIPFEAAALLIYGTNLGAIFLRFLLAAGMQGEGLRLVRLEDFFCLLSGILMMLLYYLELTGLPLVLSLVRHITHTDTTGLALVFLLSNLIPALALTPFLAPAQKLIKKAFPGDPTPRAGTPLYLTPQSLGHPSTALDLLRKELAHLLQILETRVSSSAAGQTKDFSHLAAAIEEFLLKLSTRQGLAEGEMKHLHHLRAALSAIRHMEESLGLYSARAAKIQSHTRLDEALACLLEETVQALDQLDVDALSELAAKTKKHSPFVEGLKKSFLSKEASPANLDTPALLEDFQMLVWTLHHLLGILCKLPCLPSESAKSHQAQDV